jgi:predicted Mrr-cat superfamily restriction endonuclease
MHTFVSDIRTGDRVVVPTGDRMLVGEVVGNYEWRPQAPNELCHTRPVRWLGDMARSDLERPVHLQDPRVVFALRDEPRIAAGAAAAAAPPTARHGMSGAALQPLPSGQ